MNENGGTARLIPGAMAQLPHASLAQAGGGEIAGNPRDASGKTPQTNEFELRVDVANPNDTYASGQRAYVRLLVDERPLVWQWYDRFLQLIETKSQQSKWI